MKVEISIGEAIDKLSILEIKQRIIQDGAKLAEIQKEINALDECKKYKNDYYKILMYVNEEIWNLTDRIKSMSVDNSEFSTIANEIFEFNQKRFRIKNIFNLSQKSSIREQKSYNYKNARIILQSAAQIYKKIPEIAFLTIEYDFLFIECEDDFSIVENIFKKTHPIPSNSGIFKKWVETETIETTVDLSGFCIQEELYSIFEPIPINYRAGGMFGDFIHELSVVNETFLETGRKGIIYVFEQGHPFRNGVEATYNDTYDVISKQPYVKEYKIYSGEPIDICLTVWDQYISHDSWNVIFKRAYGIEWGQNPWLNIQYDEKWSNKIIINNPDYRQHPCMSSEDAILLENFTNEIGAKLIFLSYNENDFHNFKSRYNVLNMEYYRPTSFLDMCTAIRSCKFYFGAMSGALTIAHACHTSCMVFPYGEYSADVHEINMTPTIWNNVYFNMKDAIAKMHSDTLLQSLKKKDHYIQTLEDKIAKLEQKLTVSMCTNVTGEKTTVYSFSIGGIETAPEYVFTSMHNDAFRELADITLPNKIAYCKRYKYPLLVKTENWHPIPIGFEKAHLIKEAFQLYPNCKWVFFSECDTYITNPSISLDQIVAQNEEKHFIITTDFNGINAGSFFVRNSEEGRAFIQEMMDNINNFPHEQAFIINRDDCGNHAYIISKYNQTLFNSYAENILGVRYDKFGNLGSWRPDHFIIHWAGVSYPQRVQSARDLRDRETPSSST